MNAADKGEYEHSYYVDSSYARIDGGVEAPGYLTAAQGEPNGG